MVSPVFPKTDQFALHFSTRLKELDMKGDSGFGLALREEHYKRQLKHIAHILLSPAS